MIRVVIESLLLFLLPTAIYVAFVWVTRRRTGSGKPVLDGAPLVWLAVLGASLVVIVMSFFATYTGGKPGQGYAPAVVRDGKIVPGDQ